MNNITELNDILGFEWDAGNEIKNFINHQVTKEECEQVFFNQPIFFFTDDKHSLLEDRYYVLGQTDNGRKLCIVFTVRKALIRIISARDMHRKERGLYEKESYT